MLIVMCICLTRTMLRAMCTASHVQVLLTKQEQQMPNKAATSSAGVIRGILRNPADLQRFKVQQAHVSLLP